MDRLHCVGMFEARWLVRCMFGDGCCDRGWCGVGVVTIDGLDFGCVKERVESIGCYGPCWTMVLVVVEVDTQCLVSCGGGHLMVAASC